MSRDPRPKQQAPLPTILLCPDRAAASLDMPRTTFDDKVRRGEFPYVIIGGGPHREHRRFRPADLREWVERRLVRPTSDEEEA